MRIITLNANGIRAAARKGFFGWLSAQNADVICLQETRAHLAQLTDPVYSPKGYHCFYLSAVKKGYSGVAIFSRRQPDEVIEGLPGGMEEFHTEGRWLQARFAKLWVVSAYLPSGTSGPVRQAFKYRCLDDVYTYLDAQRQQPQDYILCGDWNIAHKQIDIKNWKANQTHSGFLPEERAWLDRLFDELGWVDAFRIKEVAPDHYTWWSNRGRAWENNVGWRIDYQIISPQLAPLVNSVHIYKTQRFSDHAPLTIDYLYPYFDE